LQYFQDALLLLQVELAKVGSQHPGWFLLPLHHLPFSHLLPFNVPSYTLTISHFSPDKSSAAIMQLSAIFTTLSIVLGVAVAAPAPKSRMRVGPKSSGKGAIGATYCTWIETDYSLSSQLTSIAPPTGGAVPFGMSIISGANAVRATGAAIGFDIILLSSKNASGTGAAAGSVMNVTGQTAVCWSSHSTKTRNVYLTNIVTSLVTEASVNNLEAKIGR
jgi:hypothetical protein